MRAIPGDGHHSRAWLTDSAMKWDSEFALEEGRERGKKKGRMENGKEREERRGGGGDMTKGKRLAENLEWPGSHMKLSHQLWFIKARRAKPNPTTFGSTQWGNQATMRLKLNRVRLTKNK